jgi:CHRD domain
MNVIATINNCWRRLLPALAVLFVPAVMAQGIVYVQMPPSIRSTNDLPPGVTPVIFPEDALGTYVGDSLPIVINGQTVCTFYPGFSVGASSSSAIIAQQPLPDFPDNVWVVPLSAGQKIGPDAAGYGWFNGGLLSASTASETIEEPVLSIGYFVEVESAYLGFDFQHDGQTYYGWIDVGSPYAFVTGTLGWVYSYAYETSPNTPIQAGQISEPIYFEATFNGDNEVPPNKSTHSGNGTFVLESSIDGYTLSYNLQLDGAFQPLSAGIFGPANPRLNSPRLIADLGSCIISNLSPILFPPIGPVTFDLHRPPIILQPPIVLVYSGQITLNSSQAAELLAGQFYVNFKSAQFWQGELRGEIFPTAPIQFSATLSGRNEIPRNASAHHGEAAFILTGNNLSYELALDNFPFTSAGIYASPFAFQSPFNLISKLDIPFGAVIPNGALPNTPGLSGQLLYDGQSALNLTDEQVYRLEHGEYYINVLTSRFRNGEIGGRILPAD